MGPEDGRQQAGPTRVPQFQGARARARALLVLSHSSRDRAQVLKLTGQYDGACVLYEGARCRGAVRACARWG